MRISAIEQVLGLSKRIRTTQPESTLAELDLKPLNSEAFDIQNILFDYCGININGDLDDSLDSFSHQKRVERLFSKIRKMPRKSCLLSNFEELMPVPGKDEHKSKDSN